MALECLPCTRQRIPITFYTLLRTTVATFATKASIEAGLIKNSDF